MHNRTNKRHFATRSLELLSRCNSASAIRQHPKKRAIRLVEHEYWQLLEQMRGAASDEVISAVRC